MREVLEWLQQQPELKCLLVIMLTSFGDKETRRQGGQEDKGEGETEEVNCQNLRVKSLFPSPFPLPLSPLYKGYADYSPTPPRETQQQNLTDIQDIQIPPQTSIETNEPETIDLETQLDSEKAQLVATVEKISRIVSPYFIVIVGWSLYDSNFLIGTILILIGILSLLKISPKDVAVFFERLKSFFGLGNV